MSSRPFPQRPNLTDPELRSLIEDIMTGQKAPNPTQVLATEKLKQDNRMRAQELLLRMQLGLKTNLSSGTSNG